MMRKFAAVFLFTCLFGAPAWAQLGYQPGPGAEKNQGEIQTITKKARGNETAVRPDWYALFLLWSKTHPSDVLSGLRDPATFENFSAFMACDWVRDFRHNDIAWPQKQVQIVQKFNEHALNPPGRFRLLTYGTLGTYIAEQQQFVFRPLDGSAFSIKFPDDKIFGMEDDCASTGQERPTPQVPWPREFLMGFLNPDFVATLPMDKTKAEYFLNNLPKDSKGQPDRRLVVEIEFDVTSFFPPNIISSNEKVLPPIDVGITARRAIIYANADRVKELERVGF